MQSSAIRVLLVDDDHDDYELTRELLDAINGYELLWEPTYETGLAALQRGDADVCLLDHHLGARSGLELLGDLARSGCTTPIIMLTGEKAPSVERRAIEAGASDYLTKNGLNVDQLWRALRHAIDRRRALETLSERDHIFRAVFDGAGDAMLIVDDTGALVDENPAARALLRCEGEADVERVARLLNLATGDSWQEFIRGGYQHGTLALACCGGVKTVEYRATPRILADRHLFVLHDITQRIREEEENRALRARVAISDRMASVGVLAAGVAHEINNPLASVLLNLELARTVPSALDDAIEAAARVRDIVSDLRLFSRADADPEQRGPVDIRRAIESTKRIVWNVVRHRARLVVEYGLTPPVHANESRLGQVFLNLIVNAAQAIPEGAAEQNEVRISTRVEGDQVIAEVSDTGCGIAPENLGKIFEPFFTTKPIGEGTGLGLPICHAIVVSLGGTITVASTVGRGTTFRVALPLATAKALVPATSAPSTEPKSRRGRILVIDDEEPLLRAIGKMLEREHEVQCETDARLALARLLSGERFDLILCDLMMPHLTGMELHRELLRSLPAEADKMVFLCGGAFTTSARTFLDEVSNARLEKPFEPALLRKIVRKAVDSSC